MDLRSHFLVFLLFIFTFVHLKGQIKSYPLQKSARLAVVDPLSTQPDWRPQVQYQTPIHRPVFGEKEALYRRLKAEANANRSLATPLIQSRAQATPPHLIHQFKGNTLRAGNPNDNDLAISKDRLIMSVVNIDVAAYDSSGNVIFNQSMDAFTAPAGTSTRFDPRVLYDPLHDRFIYTCLNGFEPANSHILIAFSSTSNPADPWNLYALPANLKFNDTLDVWADFPMLGVSDNNLFVSLNLFNTDREGVAGAIWQIDLADGYAGDSLRHQVHFERGQFSLLPVAHFEKPQPLPFLFINNVAQGGEKIFNLYLIDKELGNDAKLSLWGNANSDKIYTLAPEVPQKGSDIILQTGDVRIHAAIQAEDRIYFVSNVAVNGKAGVYFGTWRMSPLGPNFSRVTAKLIADDKFEMAFPNLVYGGCGNKTDGFSLMMVVNASSADMYPGCAAIQIDSVGGVSEAVLLAEGGSPLGREGFDEWRWGDYTGIGSSSLGEVWCSAYTTGDSAENQTMISQLINTDCRELPKDSIPPKPIPQELKINIYPTPSFAEMKIDLDIPKTGIYKAEIFSTEGKLIHTLIEDRLEVAKVQLSFDASSLSPAVYFLRLTLDGKTVLSKKFVVQ